MAPIYKADRGFHVIRPLIEARESQLRAFVEDNGFVAIGDEACPAMRIETKSPHARAGTKRWLSQMEAEHDNLFKMIQASFRHIHDDTFLDPSRWFREDEKAE
jgi:tRNA(Ile)-lysidine synthase TilS/MesJ